jgi:hypothetical protein
MSKNWSNDPRVGCKSPSSLIEFIKVDGHLELEQFEGDFEREMKFLSFKCVK